MSFFSLFTVLVKVTEDEELLGTILDELFVEDCILLADELPNGRVVVGTFVDGKFSDGRDSCCSRS